MIILIICTAIISVCYIYSHNLNNPPIRSDGYGYYSYLPSFIINHDLTFQSLSLKPNGYIFPETDKFLNKYTLGTAVLQLPFFLIAHKLTLVTGLQADGFSIVYQYSNIASAFFYFVIGLIALYKLLGLIANKALAQLTVFITVFGTNLFHYATYDASFSHIYSFCMITLFLYTIIMASKKETIFKHVKIGILLGIITMVRVPNIIIVIFYLLYDVRSLADLKNKFLKANNYKYFFIAFATFCITLIPQCLYWYNITGRFLVNSYQKEVFNWLNPQTMKFLFSIQKGLFFWTPLWLLSIIGILFSKKSHPSIFLPLIIYLPLQVYICSAWWSWDYGGSFGQRPFTDIASIFALGFIMVLRKISETNITIETNEHKRKFTALPVLLIFVLLFVSINISEMIGYWNNIIPFSNTNIQDLKNLVNWFLR